MIVTNLKITNLRAIETAEFNFKSGFNLIVGVNGVGKTSVLDSLRVCLSEITKKVNKIRLGGETFSRDDIRVGAEELIVECRVHIGERNFNYLIHKPRETIVPQKKVGMPREQVYETPEKSDFLGDTPAPVTGKEPGGRPLGILFSTKRAVPSERSPSKSVAAGGVTAAFAEAFTDRELRLMEYADWMGVQIALRKEHPAAERILVACENAIRRFLPDYQNLHLGGESGKQLWIDHKGKAIPVRHLSDGERGVLVLILDLTRRLAQANPDMKDPAAEAEAIVLIDEIDLHLHPKWQKSIVENLLLTFPKCQFIATTHSPLIVGTLENNRIHIFSNGQIYSPPYSYGVDSSRILEEIMEVEPRASDIEKLLKKISQEISDEHLDNARDLVKLLVDRLGEGDPEVIRLQTLLDFLEGEE